MEKDLQISLLYDFYGGLLNPSSRLAVSLYYNEDLSLGEIAERMQITRQGVRDSVKRGEKRLLELEEKLGLLKRFSEVESGLDEISSLAAEIRGISDDVRVGNLARAIELRAGQLKE